MNYKVLAVKKLFCTICSAIIPYNPLRHKVRYILNPLNDKRVERYFREQYVLPAYQRISNLKNNIQNVDTQKGETCEYIWQCWFQGKEKAPALVKTCLQSVEKFKRDKQKVVIITAKNYTDYVSLPSFIIEKWEKGIISHAQLSDILRINLLAKYGGYWIDATCLLTAPIPKWIETCPIFMYRAYGKFDFTFIQSCFIHANTNNPIILAWCFSMEQLWKKEKKLLHYFQLHLMFKALVYTNSLAKEEFLKMPAFSEKETQTLMDFILQGAPYSTKAFETIKKKSFIHKLTYKEDIPNEFYSFYLSHQ